MALGHEGGAKESVQIVLPVGGEGVRWSGCATLPVHVVLLGSSGVEASGRAEMDMCTTSDVLPGGLEFAGGQPMLTRRYYSFNGYKLAIQLFLYLHHQGASRIWVWCLHAAPKHVTSDQQSSGLRSPALIHASS